MNEENLFGQAVTYVALWHIIIKKNLNNHLKLEILSELNKSKTNSLFRQELVEKLSIKHYKNFHMALNKLEELQLIRQEKKYKEHSQPVEVILDKKLFDFVKTQGLDKLLKKHNLD